MPEEVNNCVKLNTCASFKIDICNMYGFKNYMCGYLFSLTLFPISPRRFGTLY